MVEYIPALIFGLMIALSCWTALAYYRIEILRWVSSMRADREPEL
jgi:hypothetical protein